MAMPALAGSTNGSGSFRLDGVRACRPIPRLAKKNSFAAYVDPVVPHQWARLTSGHLTDTCARTKAQGPTSPANDDRARSRRHRANRTGDGAVGSVFRIGQYVFGLPVSQVSVVIAVLYPRGRY